MKTLISQFLTFLISLTFVASIAQAEEDVLLKVITKDGKIERFTRERLEEFEQIEFTTGSLWTEETNKYSGPPLQAVLDAAGIKEDRLEFVGLNGYSLIMDLSTDPIGDNDPIIATKMNEKNFEIWEKGPLWNIYNFDDFEGDGIERANALSVWQLSEIREVMSDQDSAAKSDSGNF